jgi:hypothetical protein
MRKESHRICICIQEVKVETFASYANFVCIQIPLPALLLTQKVSNFEKMSLSVETAGGTRKKIAVF